MELLEPLKCASLIRSIPDFPQPGILFRDITPVLADPEGFREIMDHLSNAAREYKPDKILGIESRGFLVGGPIALELGLGFVLARKPGKLPAAKVSAEYELEYGTNSLEVHRDSMGPGDRVLIVDDLLATGGTAAAAGELVEKLGAQVAGYLFFIELTHLQGRDKLAGRDVKSLVKY